MLKMKFLKNNILEPVLSAKETLLKGKYNRIILCNMLTLRIAILSYLFHHLYIIQHFMLIQNLNKFKYI